MDDKQSYLRWLEEMWSVQRFDIHGSMEQEEERTGKRSLRCSGALYAFRGAA
jgi:hypothetical protein